MNKKLHYLLILSCVLLLAACGNSANDRLEKAYQKTLKKNTSEPSTVKDKSEPLLENPVTEKNAREVLTAYGKANPENQVIIHTRLGDIKIRLFEETPLHRANFIRLAKNKFYDQGEFNRVIKDFMIQGGDSDDRKMGINRYTVPIEPNAKFFHKRGAVAMAKFDSLAGSSSHYFFIVQGTKLKDSQLDAISKEFKLNLTPEQRQAYKTIGGVPQLDGRYTIFGEVTEGLDVVDKIASLKTDKREWPLEEVNIKMEVLPR
ncbi:peptidylprolyl isomerase [Rhodocytophaga rosea]|uniref:Peptidyl-prolyl cis-trans isomerase n=1 Tax=Rhodocytophaga rosea TaxID=2704465 RepID=A0A6C0GPN3_9BACT|nr:peptidylprolyl isomerase [Rhodocytophaga rosea]QHT69867.1 peptidylprolyl isomerase [Rhodocytophaga rosea]